MGFTSGTVFNAKLIATTSIFCTIHLGLYPSPKTNWLIANIMEANVFLSTTSYNIVVMVRHTI